MEEGQLPGAGNATEVVNWALGLAEGVPDPENVESFTLYVLLSILMVLVAGLMSGLTIGLMAMDEIDLEVLKRSGSLKEQKYAKAIQPLLRNHHFLLCTLVLWNAAAMETLPLFIDRLADPVTAVALSVSVVLIFGEIVPQSVCTRHGLAVGYYSAWMVRVFMFIAAPVAWPLGRVLDYLLGHSDATLPRGQLAQYLALHGEEEGYAQGAQALTRNELHVIHSALDLTAKTAREAATPLEAVFMVEADAVMDEELVTRIIRSGHSRVPVCAPGDRTAILGLLLVKELLLKVRECHKVSDLPMRPLPSLSASMPMYDVLQLFKTGRSHMALLCEASEEDKSKAREDIALHGVPSASFRAAAADAKHGQHSQSSPDLHHPLLEPMDSSGLACCMSDTYIDMAVGRPIGIITIEDVIEELIGEEIVDETDRFVDNAKTSRVSTACLAEALPDNLRMLLSLGVFTPRSPGRRRGTRSRPESTAASVHAGVHFDMAGELDGAEGAPVAPTQPASMNMLGGERRTAFAAPEHQPWRKERPRSAKSAGGGGGGGGGGDIDVAEAFRRVQQRMEADPGMREAVETLQTAVGGALPKGGHASTSLPGSRTPSGFMLTKKRRAASKQVKGRVGQLVAAEDAERVTSGALSVTAEEATGHSC